MAIRPYSGSARPIDEVLEGQPGVSVVEWDDPDESIYRGYQLADGRLVGSCFVVSAARQAIKDAESAVITADENERQTFLDACQDLFLKARAHALAPAQNPALTTREVNEAIARLFRLVRHVYKVND